MKNLIKFLITCYKSLGFLLSNPIFKVLRLSWYFLFSLYLYFNYFEYLNATCEVIVSNSSFFNQYYALSLLGIDDVGIIASLEGVFEFQQSVSFLFIIILVITIVLCHHFSWKVVLSFLGIVGGSIYKAYCNFLNNQELLLHFPIFDFKIYRRWDDSEKLNFICEALNSLNYSIDTIDIDALLLYLNSNNIKRKDAIISSTMEWVNSNYSGFSDTVLSVNMNIPVKYLIVGGVVIAGICIAGMIFYDYLLKPIMFGDCYDSCPDPLPPIIQHVNEAVDHAFHNINSKAIIKLTSQHVAAIGGRQTNTLAELNKVRLEVIDVSDRVDVVDTKVTNVNTKVNAVDTKVTNVDTKVNAVDAKVDALDAKVDTRLDAIYNLLMNYINNS